MSMSVSSTEWHGITAWTVMQTVNNSIYFNLVQLIFSSAVYSLAAPMFDSCTGGK